VIMQITTRTIRLIDVEQKRLVSEWSMNADEYISVATVNDSKRNEILVASRNMLIYLRVGNSSEIQEVIRHKLDFEIACLDINHDLGMCAVGLWTDISARLFRLPTLEQIHCEPLGGDIIPRSILIDVLDFIKYLFVSLGDGSVISYVINDSCELVERRKIVLGTQPTILKKFKTPNANTSNIFACSDRPSVISTNNQKLIYSSVNLKQVDYMCSFNSETYQNCMALLTENGILRIGTMDNIQKLHIRTINLFETPRRLAYQAETHTFGLITYRIDYLNHLRELRPCRESASTQCQNIQVAHTDLSKTTNSITTASGPSTSTDIQLSSEYDQYITHSLLILDQNTFEILHSVKFQLYEYVVSIISMSFDAESTYYICGSCYVHDDEPEPKTGRLVLFKYINENNKLVQVCEKEVKGAPYSMCNYVGNKLLVSVSNSVKLFDFKNDQFVQLAQYSDNVFITHIKCKNDFILVNDVMRSCSVLIYRHETSVFELVARDNMPIWSNASEILDDENFIISDSFYNVVTLKKDRYFVV
jgi:DNA damage-binding protein 1